MAGVAGQSMRAAQRENSTLLRRAMLKYLVDYCWAYTYEETIGGWGKNHAEDLEGTNT